MVRSRRSRTFLLHGQGEPLTSQAAFALVFFQSLYATGRDIRNAAIERLESLCVERRPVFVSGVTEILEPDVREFRLIIRKLVYKLMECFA
jgi:hypothetical protein